MGDSKMNKVQRTSLVLKQLSEASIRGCSTQSLMQALRLDIYDVSDKKNFSRTIATLRSIGYPVVYDASSERYYLDTEKMIDVSLNGHDLTLIKAAITQAQPQSHTLSLVLDNALSKLHSSGFSRRELLPFAAQIPTEDLLFRIVGAIENTTQLRFMYRGTSHDTYVQRDFRPHFVFCVSRAFYVCGLSRPVTVQDVSGCDNDFYDYDFDELDGPPEDFLYSENTGEDGFPAGGSTQDWTWRTYKIARISPDTIEEHGTFTPHDTTQARANVASFFTEHDVLCAIRPGKAHALRSIAQPLPMCDDAPAGWDCFRLVDVDKRFLFERLMTYGCDVVLLGDDHVRQEWVKRLEHLSCVTGGGSCG